MIAVRDFIAAQNINSNYAIYNAAFGDGPFQRTLTSVWNSGQTQDEVLFEKSFTTVTGQVLIMASALMAQGQDPGYAPANGCRITLTVRMIDVATGNTIRDLVVFDSQLRPAMLNNQNGSINLFVGIGAGQQTKIQFRMRTVVGSLGGTGSPVFQENYRWNVTQANILFLEPNGT